MRIETNKGKSYEINAIAPYTHKNQILIDMNDDRPFSEIATDFDGVETITRKMVDDGSAYEKYEGYTKLFSITKIANDRVRITLAKG